VLKVDADVIPTGFQFGGAEKVEGIVKPRINTDEHGFNRRKQRGTERSKIIDGKIMRGKGLNRRTEPVGPTRKQRRGDL
jgi:hypothetical protein